MKYDNKIAVVVRDDLETWQKLNITAFLMGGIGGTQEVVGEPCEDASGNRYLPLIQQPVLIFSAKMDQMKTVYERASKRGLKFNIYTEDLFTT